MSLGLLYSKTYALSYCTSSFLFFFFFFFGHNCTVLSTIIFDNTLEVIKRLKRTLNVSSNDTAVTTTA